MAFKDLTELIEEVEFAKMIQVPLSRLKKWRILYGAPYYSVKCKIYYNSAEFWEWYNSDLSPFIC